MSSELHLERSGAHGLLGEGRGSGQEQGTEKTFNSLGLCPSSSLEHHEDLRLLGTGPVVLSKMGRLLLCKLSSRAIDEL